MNDRTRNLNVDIPTPYALCEPVTEDSCCDICGAPYGTECSEECQRRDFLKRMGQE